MTSLAVLTLLGMVLYVHVHALPNSDFESNQSFPKAVANSRVQYGDVVPLNLMRYVARLDITDKKGESFLCGGSLIRDDVVLSAAHCFYGDNGKLTARRVKVYLRDYSEDEEVDPFIAEGVIAPSAYNPNKKGGSMYGDIALLFLTELAETKPARIASSRTKVKGDLIVAGYGETESDDYSEDLLYATLPHLSDYETENEFDDYLEKDHFGAGLDEDEQLDRQGDSGGPIIIPGRGWKAEGTKASEDIIVGVVSYGPGDFKCGDRNSVSAYTEIRGWRKWIDSAIEDYEFDALRT